MSIDPEAFAQHLLATDAVFEELIAYQRKRVAEVAARINPRLTSDDLLNPHDYEELEQNGRFQYEDGMLNGYIAAQMAWRARALGPGREMLEAAGWQPKVDGEGEGD